MACTKAHEACNKQLGSGVPDHMSVGSPGASESVVVPPAPEIQPKPKASGLSPEMVQLLENAGVPAAQGATLRLSQMSGEVGNSFVALGSGKYGARGDGEQTTERVAPSAHRPRIGHGIEAFKERA